MTVILEREQVQKDISKPWCCKQVTNHLSNLLYWVHNGYRFTEDQKEQLGWLREAVNGK